jgi:hypothetical protein
LKFSDKKTKNNSKTKKLNKKLKQSATQLWLLGVNLPLMVGVNIPEDDIAWTCFTTLLNILRLVFASSISNFQLAQLETLIDEYLVGYKNSFDLDIIPKMHHLVHYPGIIREIGPLGAFWCMRYEAKHSYFNCREESGITLTSLKHYHTGICSGNANSFYRPVTNGYRLSIPFNHVSNSASFLP